MIDFPKPLVPGVYFGLPNDDYHDDRALGSTNIRKLRRSGPDYWYGSPLNPRRPVRKPNKYLTFGHAIHTRVLEGPAAFDKLFECEPDREGLLITMDDLREFCERAGFDKVPRSKAGLIELALKIDKAARILDVIKQRAEEAGRTLVDLDDYERMMIATALITKNPELSTAFMNGMPEVSVVFDRDDGVRCKTRFDYLKPRGIADLKSIRNPLEKDFEQACRERFCNARYDIPAELYLEGRARLPGLVKAGRVFGECDPALLTRIVEAPEFAISFIFLQAEDAPITWSFTLSPGNPILSYAREHIEQAIRTYKQFMDAFGPDQMWVLAKPTEELDINELPGWYGR